MDVISYLDGKGIRLHDVGNGQAYTHCFFCDEDPSKHGRLYFNVEPGSDRYGLYNCFLCSTSGGPSSLLRHFGDSESGFTIPSDSIHRRIFSEAATYYHECLLENVEAYEYLVYTRGLTDETIDRTKLGWSDGGLITHLKAHGFSTENIKETGLINRFGNDFLENQITIPYFDFGEVVTIRGKDIKGKYLSLPGSGGTYGLYGLDSIRGYRDPIITAGEFDAIVLQQLGYPACGAPGENTFKEEWVKEFDTTEGRVFVLYDNDNAGTTGSEKVASKFGPRARVASFPKTDKKIDVTKWYVDHNKVKEDFDMLLIKAKGGLLVSVGDAYDRWLEVEGNPTLVGTRFNIKEIDSAMTHGLLPAQVCTLLAKTNAGKTIMTINILYRMLQADPNLQILYVSLEQTRNEWFERAHRINNFYHPGASVNETMDYWRNNFLMIDKNRLSKDELEVCVDQYAFDTGRYPDVVAIDYLGYYARSYRGEEYTRITDAIMDSKSIAKERGLKMIIPHQANRQGNFGKEFSPDQGRGSGAVEETSDLMLMLWAPDQAEGIEQREQKRQLKLKIAKSRDGGVNTLATMQFCPLTLAVIPKSDPLYPRAMREVAYAIAGDDWQTAINRYVTGDETVRL